MSAIISVDRRAISANMKSTGAKKLPVFNMRVNRQFFNFMSGSVYGALYLDYDPQENFPYLFTEGEIEMSMAIRDDGRSLRKHTIHVNRSFIAQNRQGGVAKPVYTVKTRGVSHARYGQAVLIPSYSDLVYSSYPISGCGARVWVETDDDIKIVNEMTFQQAKEITG